MRKEKKILISIMAILLLLVIAGINDGQAESKQKRKSISIYVGENYKLKLKKGSIVSSSNKKIAKVNKKGKIVAIKEGKCVVKVKYKKKNTKYSVTVLQNKDDNLPVPTPVRSDDLPAPTPGPLNGGTEILKTGLYIDRIVPKDSDTSYVYMGRNPHATISAIGEDSPIKYIMIEATNKNLDQKKEGDCVAYLHKIDSETELVGDTLYVRGRINYIMSEEGIYPNK